MTYKYINGSVITGRLCDYLISHTLHVLFVVAVNNGTDPGIAFAANLKVGLKIFFLLWSLRIKILFIITTQSSAELIHYMIIYISALYYLLLVPLLQGIFFYIYTVYSNNFNYMEINV